ncbi:DMT family transporter [Vibrio diazotrophicus]|uniref:DMT family transporter n=1 Tax=Vibrio diazotrophicus TaxID=685 RepID=UPI000694E381|nr:DMT family transporter [Vibrio diazotrophicus]
MAIFELGRLNTGVRKLSESRAVIVFFFLLPPLFWAGNFIVGRAVRDEIPPVTLSFSRWVLASILLLPFSYKFILKEWKLYIEQWRLTLVTSITGFAAFNSFIYLGLQSTPATNGTLLNAFIPILISIFGALFFGLAITWRLCLGITLSLCGILTIVSAGDWNNLLALNINYGDFIIFLAMVCWAIYTIGLKQLPPTINRLGLMSVQMILAILALLPFYLWEVYSGQYPVWNAHSIMSLLYIGIFPSIGAFLLYMQCVKLLGPAKASLSVHLIPVFGAMLSALFLGEFVQIYHLWGIILIFLGVILS